MFDADRPILKSDQDKLNRSVFAKYLARCLLDHKDPQSLVVGLYGGFGSGKTSLLNLILEELEFASTNTLDEEKPIILNFSPWSYSGQNQLIYSFFRRLSSALRSAPYFSGSQKIIHLLELYISFHTHQPVPKALRFQQKWWQPWRNRADAYGWESGRDLTQVKAELNELLRKQPHKIIIVIDNISRLYDQEIKQMFQVIKSMGDYANTIYLLALDKDQVVSAINRIEGGAGEALLEKIVQLSFDVPAITRQDLENILLDKLKLIMPEVPPEDWDSSDWADVYYSSLRYFFETCRDITRYLNGLSFGYPRVKDVVNPVDYFALTAIEVFLPEVYAGIRDNKDLFTDLIEGVYQFDQEKLRKDRLRCDEIMNRATRLNREILMRLLIFLFPRLQKVYQPEETIFHSESLARKQRRVCCPDMFEAYFRLSMQAGYISSEEMETILQLASDEEAFIQALTRLNQDLRIEKFLDLLDSMPSNKIPNENVGHIINSLLDNGDLFPEGESSLLRFDTAMRIHRIIQHLLKRYEKPEQRFSLLRHSILKAAKSLHIIVQVVRALEREQRIQEDLTLSQQYRTVTPEQLLVLQKLTVERIQFWARINRLTEHPQLLPILYAWKNWGTEEDCQRYLQKITLEDEGLLAFLRAIFQGPIQDARKKQARNSSWDNALTTLTDFLPPKWLEQHAKALFEDLAFEKLRDEDQLALMIFLDLMKTETTKMIPKTV